MTFCIFIVSTSVICIVEKTVTKRGALIQEIFRSNFIIYVLPVAVALFGDEAASLTSFAIAVIIPIYNFLRFLFLKYSGAENLTGRK